MFQFRSIAGWAAGLSLLTGACIAPAGSTTDSGESDVGLVGPKLDFSGRNEEFFTHGVESNIPTAAVTRLHFALNQAWAEREDTCDTYSGIRGDRIVEIYEASEDLSREFGDLVAADDRERMHLIWLGLREILHNGGAIRRFRADLEEGNYRSVILEYIPMRREVLGDLGDTYDDDEPPEGALPTIVINIPAERIQLFHDGTRLHDEPIVVGQREYDNYNMNSKTRVGDHAIASWHHCYSNAEYPAWCDDRNGGAFGEWTAKLDRGFQYIHGSIGRGLINWGAIKFAPGSHGCVRNRNSHIRRIHDIAPTGTWVRKIYAVYERSARVENTNRRTGARRSTSDRPCNRDPFGDSRHVDFREREHDNQYRYDVDTYPDTLPEAHHIHRRPNGIYYPETGVVVGYAHPPDAMTQPF